MNDALARLRNRQRPTVPDRDTSLTTGSPDIPTSRNQDSPISEFPIVSTQPPSKASSQAVNKPANTDTSPTEASTNQELEIPKTQDIGISTLPDVQEFATKQSTLRLEAELSDRLQSLCRQEGICREVLIEAMFEHLENHPEIAQVIMATAQTKNEHRQQIANLKRAQSMMKRFSGSS
jgi:predicted DNA-binding protein